MISIVFRYYTSEQALYRLLRLFFKKSERTHSAAPPFQAANAPLVCGLMRWGFGLVHLFRQHSSARHKRHIACDELFIKAHRSLILLCLAFRPANASLVYRARELRNTKISELLPPGTSECACAAAPPLRIEPAASGFGLALGAGPKAAAPIRLQYNKRSEQSSPCSDLFAFSGKEHHPPAPLMRSIPGVRG